MNRKIGTVVVAAALSVGLLFGTAATAEAGTGQVAHHAGNPWGTQKDRRHVKHMSVSRWHRYARQHHAHHLGHLDGHSRCWVIYGPTSYGECKDGYRFTS